MRIIIDVLTPKQVMFLPRLSESLEKRGHRVFKATRKYREVLQILRVRGIDAIVVGEHGGKGLRDKLRASTRRTLELATLFEEVNPDLSISFSSPEMARVSYGLNVPHMCINDSPHAKAVARLTIPLSERLFTPKMIPKRAWARYGIPPGKIIRYNALDPYVWLKDFKPDRSVLRELGLDDSKPILTVRTEETFAAYLLGKTQRETSLIPIIEKILEQRGDLQIVAVPRYREQIRALQEAFKDGIVLCEFVIDGPSLLHYTSVFIGGGGTMSAEAALLGVPTFSCYPGESFLIERYLIRKKLVRRETDPEKLVKKILSTLSNAEYERERQTEKVRRLVRDFEDPVDVIEKEVEKFS